MTVFNDLLEYRADTETRNYQLQWLAEYTAELRIEETSGKVGK